MRRLVPYPVLALGLVLMWLMLTRASLGHLLLGTLVSTLACQALRALDPETSRVRRWRPVLTLLSVVAVDILRSNFAVARLILRGGQGRRTEGDRRSGFVSIPLRLRGDVPLAILATILSATPGTAWIEYDPATGLLLLHVFDLIDEAQWRDIVSGRYEALLLEIFA